MDFFDLHCDTPYECYKKNQEFEKNTLAVSADKGAIFSEWYQTFAVWIRDDAPNPYSLYRSIIDNFKGKLKNKPQNLTPIFALEGGAAIENTDCLYKMKDDGIRFITLSWNGENSIAGGVNCQKGITDYGKAIIKIMNELKIGCDLSHLNEKSFYKALELSDFPLATHSNCKAVCPHPRNLTDGQIRLIAQKSGVIGLCPYPEFLGEEPFGGIYKNICRILDMGYEDIISIGTDFDGAEMDKNLDSVDKIPRLYGFLREKGLNDALLYKIFFENANKFIAKL